MTKNMDLALTVAREHVRLSQAGHWGPEHDQMKRSIDELVGYWNEGQFVWPNNVTRAWGTK